MAFQAPSRARKPAVSKKPAFQDPALQSRASPRAQTPASDADEWIVFSPSVAGDTNTIFSGGDLFSHEHSEGSLLTVSTPQNSRHTPIPGTFDAADEDEADDADDADDDDDEAYSLGETDSLQAFRDHAAPILFPAHDGLGSFAPAGAPSLARSLQLIAAAEHGRERAAKHSRIHRWRMEQGHALMAEIERATRRRRAAAPAAADDTLWQRITRTFIRDFIGLDDHLLEVIFGEALPHGAAPAPAREPDDRILARLAKELGELVHLYTQHPGGGGAFSTARAAAPAQRQEDAAAALWGIEEDAAAGRREYWEQDLDMTRVFSFIKARFSAPAEEPAHARRPAKAPGSCASQDRERRGSRSGSRARGHYWDVASSGGSGPTSGCVAWAAI